MPGNSDYVFIRYAADRPSGSHLSEMQNRHGAQRYNPLRRTLPYVAVPLPQLQRHIAHGRSMHRRRCRDVREAGRCTAPRHHPCHDRGQRRHPRLHRPQCIGCGRVSGHQAQRRNSATFHPDGRWIASALPRRLAPANADRHRVQANRRRDRLWIIKMETRLTGPLNHGASFKVNCFA
jgi:hypothetical protein